MLINFPHLLNEVNVVVIATELTLASARDTIRILSWLKTNASHATPIVVANKFQANALEISKADFEASIERKIDFLVPFDQAAAAKAAKLGQAFVEANAQSKAAAQIKALGERILGAAEEDDGDVAPSAKTAGGKKSLLGGLDLKALLAKKEKGSKQPA
jgi:pilus assembly protein CpaE